MDNLCVPSTALAVTFACATCANADFALVYSGMSALEQIHYTYTSDPSVMWDAPTRDADTFGFAGRILFNDGAIDGFCIELEQAVASDANPYSLQSFDERSNDEYERGRLLSSLFQQYYQQVVDSDSNAMAAAFQVMAWELTHENFSSYEEARSEASVLTGATQFDGLSVQALDYFQQMQNDLFVSGNTDGIAVLHNNQFQDFVTVVVPAPSALAIAGFAMAAGRRRRRS